jgi:hypothetical protein
VSAQNSAARGGGSPGSGRINTGTKGSVRSRLTGVRCRCGACGQHFNSVSVFDRHRRGNYRDHGVHRRCLTPAEMRAKGWQVSGAGFWIERRRPRVDRDRTRRSDVRQKDTPTHCGLDVNAVPVSRRHARVDPG